MARERIKRTVALAYAATAVTQLAEIGYNFLLYKSFAVSELGLFAWAAALIVFLNMAVDLGLEPILTRHFAARRLTLRDAIVASIAPRVPIILVAYAAVMLASYLNMLDQQRALFLLLLGGQAFFNVLDGIFKAWLRANGKQTSANALAALFALLKFSAVAILVIGGRESITALLGILLVLRGAVSMVTYFVVRRIPLSETPAGSGSMSSLIKHLLGAGLTVGGISVLTGAQNRLDWLLVSYFVSVDALAGYSLANKLYEISQVIVGTSLITIYPWLCRNDMDRSAIDALVRMIIVGGSALGFFGAVLGPPIVELLFGQKFLGIEGAVVVLMLAVAFMATNGVLYQVALSSSKERQILFATLVATALQFGANLILIPRWGISGAAFGMFILALATSIGLSIIAYRERLMEPARLVRIFVFLGGYTLTAVLLLGLDIHGTFQLALFSIGLISGAWFWLFECREKEFLIRFVGAAGDSCRRWLNNVGRP
jgi:O-antigen/teichoic acid export membrane protein